MRGQAPHVATPRWTADPCVGHVLPEGPWPVLPPVASSLLTVKV